MNDKKETKYYLTDSPIEEIKGNYARWLVAPDPLFPGFTYDQDRGLCFYSLNGIKEALDLKKDGSYSLKIVEYINNKFNRIITEKELFPNDFEYPQIKSNADILEDKPLKGRSWKSLD